MGKARQAGGLYSTGGGVKEEEGEVDNIEEERVNWAVSVAGAALTIEKV